MEAFTGRVLIWFKDMVHIELRCLSSVRKYWVKTSWNYRLIYFDNILGNIKSILVSVSALHGVGIWSYFQLGFKISSPWVHIFHVRGSWILFLAVWSPDHPIYEPSETSRRTATYKGTYLRPTTFMKYAWFFRRSFCPSQPNR